MSPKNHVALIPANVVDPCNKLSFIYLVILFLFMKCHTRFTVKQASYVITVENGSARKARRRLWHKFTGC
jgi:hypothetical protein